MAVITGQLLSTLVITAVFVAGARVHRLSGIRRWLAIAVIIGLINLPINGLSAVTLMRGLFGDFSITTGLVCLLGLVDRLDHRRLLNAGGLGTLMYMVAATAVVFYPLSLGLTLFDPYAWGYMPRALVGVLGLVSLLAWYRREYLVATAIPTAILAHQLHLLESDNLWDYLMDPFLAIHCLGALLCRLARWLLHLLWQSSAVRRSGPARNA